MNDKERSDFFVFHYINLMIFRLIYIGYTQYKIKLYLYYYAQ